MEKYFDFDNKKKFVESILIWINHRLKNHIFNAKDAEKK